MSFFSHQFVIEGYPKSDIHDAFSAGQNVTGQMPWAQFGQDSPVHGRRYFAMSFNFAVDSSGQHFASGIFDRDTEVFVFFDTVANQVKYRVAAAAIKLGEYLSKHGFHARFSVMCPPTTEQPNNYACGYLSVFNILQNLRLMDTIVNSKTVSYDDLWNQSDKFGLPIHYASTDHLTLPPQGFELPFIDWASQGRSQQESFDIT